MAISKNDPTLMVVGILLIIALVAFYGASALFPSESSAKPSKYISSGKAFGESSCCGKVGSYYSECGQGSCGGCQKQFQGCDKATRGGCQKKSGECGQRFSLGNQKRCCSCP